MYPQTCQLSSSLRPQKKLWTHSCIFLRNRIIWWFTGKLKWLKNKRVVKWQMLHFITNSNTIQPSCRQHVLMYFCSSSGASPTSCFLFWQQSDVVDIQSELVLLFLSASQRVASHLFRRCLYSCKGAEQHVLTFGWGLPVWAKPYILLKLYRSHSLW